MHSSQLRIIGEGACKAPDPPGRPPGCCLSPPGPLAPLPRCPAIPQATQGARPHSSSSPTASQLAAAAAAAHPLQECGLAGVRGTSSCGHHGVLAVWQEEDAGRWGGGRESSFARTARSSAAPHAAPPRCPAPSPLPPSPRLLPLANLGAELLRENKRMLDRAIRELDRERMGLQNQVRQLV